MLPDDPRHGSVAGYNAHRRASTVACDACRRAKMRYEKERILRGPKKVSAIGTRRRIQALRALGYSLAELAEAGGWQTEHAAFKYPMTADTITATTAGRVAEVYERLCMTPATGPRANRLRIIARRNGWFPPLAWDDIDYDPDFEVKKYADEKIRDDVDVVLVDRILGGDMYLCKRATAAERREVIARWVESGRALRILEQQSGWNVWRDRREVAA